ncbi:MAG TPA: hypothetical protein VFF11_13555 [Candidatus Binatia bacterium]|nr:hypothetical protein [Candidatus Binatia bacterium]
MKLALTILCSLLLALTPAMSAQFSPVTMTPKAHAVCGCGGKMPCCAARSTSHSNPAPLTATSVSSQNLISVPVASVIGWLPPASEIFLPSFRVATASMADGLPLYKWDCALLI